MDKKVERVARDLFHVLAMRIQSEGLRPQDELVGAILASCIGAHYLMRGGGPRLREEMIDLVNIALDKADAHG